MSNYKKTHTFDEMHKEASRILSKYPDRLPVIVEVDVNCKDPSLKLDKNKYLVPYNLTVGQLIHVIRKHTQLDSKKAMFIFFGNILAPTAAPISMVYDEHKDECGYLFSTVTSENTFG